MEKIDRLGWAAGISFVSYGLRIGVRTNNPEVMDRLLDLLPPGTKPARGPRVERLYSLVVGRANTVSVRRQPERSLATLRQVALEAPVLKGVRGEVEEMVDALLNKASERASNISMDKGPAQVRHMVVERVAALSAGG